MIYTSDNNLTINNNTIVELTNNISMRGINLPVSITADFKDIPEHFHEIFLQMLIISYDKTISIYG
jgi:hypothetical protein